MARRVRPVGIGRLEAFSDAVFAIVLTLLVLHLLPSGPQSPSRLLASWPTYLTYRAAFLTIGIIWLNHNHAMSRLRSANPTSLVSVARPGTAVVGVHSARDDGPPMRVWMVSSIRRPGWSSRG
jgi:hypothetical protein